MWPPSPTSAQVRVCLPIWFYMPKVRIVLPLLLMYLIYTIVLNEYHIQILQYSISGSLKCSKKESHSIAILHLKKKKTHSITMVSCPKLTSCCYSYKTSWKYHRVLRKCHGICYISKYHPITFYKGNKKVLKIPCFFGGTMMFLNMDP